MNTENKFFSRKFLIILILLLVGFLVDFFTDRGLSVPFKEFMLGLAGIYVAGNGVSSISRAVVERATPPKSLENQINPEVFHKLLTDVDSSLHNIREGQDTVIQNIGLTNQGLARLLKNRQ